MKRVFFGIKIPFEGKVKSLINETKLSFNHENIKWVSPQNLHLTLLFMGDREEEKIAEITDYLKERIIDRQPFDLRLKGLGAFKSPGNPRVLWIGTEPSEELQQLKYDLDRLLVDLGMDIEPDKAFHPHLTIARPKFIKDRNTLKNWIKENKSRELDEITVSSFTFFESKLSSKGPIYNSLYSFEFVSR